MTAAVEQRDAAGSVSAGFAGRLIRRPVGMVSIAVIALIVVACVAAPLIAPYSPLDQDLQSVMKMPSAAHLLGTDQLGRDVLSRLLYGGQSALLGVLIAVASWAVVGIPVGLLAGYAGGRVDRWIGAAVDLLMSLPAIVIVLAVLALFDNSLAASMVTLGVLSSGGLLRIVRAVTMTIRGELYVSAARVSGLGDVRILARHILPGIVGPVVVQLSIFAGVALTVQAGLGFLGLGVAPPAPSWGGMVGEAAQLIEQFPWLLVPSGGVIAVTILAFGLLGDAARDAVADSRKAPSRGHQRSARVAAGTSRAESGRADGDQEVLSVSALTVQFDGASPPAVDDITFSLRRGEIVGLVGESGSGKTVTSLAILGLLPGHAHVAAAHLRIAGEDLLEAGDKELARVRGHDVAYISQEPMASLDPSFTVASLLREVIRRHHPRLGRTEVRARTVRLLGRVRLPEPESVMSKYPFQLSGGMAQRVVIAMALAGSPTVLIADEPTTALDVTVQAEILDLLRDLRDELGMAILLVTHDLGVVADLCDRVMVMQHGVIVERAACDELFEKPRHPYTRQLLAATPNLLGAER